MYKNILLISLLLLSCTVCAQTYNRQYFPDSNGYAVNDFSYNNNSTFIASVNGVTRPGGYFGYKLNAVKLNNFGDTVWVKRNILDSIRGSIAPSCAQLSNGNIMVTAVSYDTGGGNSTGTLIKLSATGNILLTRSRGYQYSAANLENMKVIADNSGGYYTISDVDSLYYNISGTNLDYHVVNRSYVEKYDSSDHRQWVDTFENVQYFPSGTLYNYSTTFIDHKYAQLSKDGGLTYPILYDTVYPNGGTYRYKMQKINKLGHIEWTEDLQNLLSVYGNNYVTVDNMFSTSDSCMVLNCYTTDSAANVKTYLYKINSSGNLVDSTSISVNASGSSYYGTGMETSNGTYLVNVDNNNDIGFILFDKHLHYISYTPSPFWYMYKLAPNNLGGAFTAYETYYNSVYRIQVINFDSLFNTYPSSVSGNLILDKNDNCTTEAADLRITANPIMMTDAQNNQWFAFTNDTGHYKINVPTGNYTLGHQVYGYKGTECPATSALSYTIPTPAQYTGVNLYDTLTRNKPNISASIYSYYFVPGFDNTLYLNVNNYGTVTANTTLTFVKDQAIQYLSSVPAPTSISGDTLTYIISNLPADSALNFVVNLHTPVTASAGQPLSFYANAPFTNDLTPADNTATLVDTVVSSFDPNELTVNKPVHYDPNTGEMIYSVEFQNTGSYYAKNVVVVDTVDSHLDMSSFHLIKGSPFKPIISWWEGNRLLFTYNNIMLPDSMQNPKTSIGSFVYGIKPKGNVRIGDTIRNTAYIYFDFNKAVVTNSTMNIISKTPNAVPTVAYSNDMAVYPNPSAGTFTILLPQQSSDWKATMLDMTGREMKCTTTTNGNKIVLNTNAPNGIYLLQLMNTTTKESVVKKITVLR